MPKIGTPAPYFNLDSVEINEVSKQQLSTDQMSGSWNVIYFYPKDFTEGCTIEARGFNKLESDFQKLNAKIIGISSDNYGDHQSFCNKEKLRYTLLSDIGGKVSQQYGSWKDPYSIRNTFLIDPKGIIRQRWVDVKPIRHADIVLEELKRIKSQ